MPSELGNEEGHIGHLFYHPFGVGASAVVPILRHRDFPMLVELAGDRLPLQSERVLERLVRSLFREA